MNVKTHVLTDAHGDYLFTQVPLGEVFVVAIPKNAALVDGRLNRSGYKRGVTYYPSAARVEEALPVTVNVRAAQKADIRLTSVPLAAVGGTSSSTPTIGRPPVRRRWTLVARGDHLFGVAGGGVALHPDGSFGIAGLSPGTYFPQYREGTWPPPRDVTPLVSGATVVIDGSDMNGVRVSPIHMGTGVGAGDCAGGIAGGRSACRRHRWHRANRFRGQPWSRPTRRALKDDLTFECATWPGPHRPGRGRPGRLRLARIKAVRFTVGRR